MQLPANSHQAQATLALLHHNMQAQLLVLARLAMISPRSGCFFLDLIRQYALYGGWLHEMRDDVDMFYMRLRFSFLLVHNMND